MTLTYICPFIFALDAWKLCHAWVYGSTVSRAAEMRLSTANPAMFDPSILPYIAGLIDPSTVADWSWLMTGDTSVGRGDVGTIWTSWAFNTLRFVAPGPCFSGGGGVPHNWGAMYSMVDGFCDLRTSEMRRV